MSSLWGMENFSLICGFTILLLVGFRVWRLGLDSAVFVYLLTQKLSNIYLPISPLVVLSSVCVCAPLRRLR